MDNSTELPELRIDESQLFSVNESNSPENGSIRVNNPSVTSRQSTGEDRNYTSLPDGQDHTSPDNHHDEELLRTRPRSSLINSFRGKDNTAILKSNPSYVPRTFHLQRSAITVENTGADHETTEFTPSSECENTATQANSASSESVQSETNVDGNDVIDHSSTRRGIANPLPAFEEFARDHGISDATITILVARGVLEPDVLMKIEIADLEELNIRPVGQLHLAQHLVRQMKVHQRRCRLQKENAKQQTMSSPTSQTAAELPVDQVLVSQIEIEGEDDENSVEPEVEQNTKEESVVDEEEDEEETSDEANEYEVGSMSSEGSFEDSVDDSLEIREEGDEVFDTSKQSRKKNLILDEDKFEDIFLKCLICRELFNDDDKAPKMLTCHHTFCLDCLRQMFRVEGEFRQTLTSAFRGMPIAVKIQCPTCRDAFIISEAEIIRLPNDFTIIELLNFVKSQGKSDMQYCSKHQLQSLNFFCEPCGIAVCSDCTVLDHKEDSGHVVLNIDKALDKYTPLLNTTMSKLEDEKTRLGDNKVSLERAHENVETIRRELNNQIRQTFDRLREALEEREKDLFDISERDIDRKRDKILANLKLVNERISVLKKHSDVLESASSEKDIRNMVGIHQNVQESLSKPLEIVDDTPDDFSVTFHFNSKQETLIKNQISNLGDVTFEHS